MDEDGSKDYWTRTKIAKLIELYKSQDCLWNVSNPSYRDKRKRIAAWKVIATAMGYDVMSVERKMKVLKTQFMHCYKLYKKYSINGDSYQPKWFAYNSLRFLIPAKIYRENREISRMQEQGVQLIKTETIDLPSEENFMVNEREEPQSPADVTLRNPPLNIPPPMCHSTSLNPNVAFRPDTRRNEETSVQRCHPVVGRDEYSIFGEWIACRMRNLQDPRARLTLQFNINNLLFDAEMQEIDRNNDSSHPDITMNGM